MAALIPSAEFPDSPDGQADTARYDHGQPDFLPEIAGPASGARTSISGHVHPPGLKRDRKLHRYCLGAKQY
jgi:hypothetical protein